MQTVFADSFYFFALANARDPAHAKAVAFSRAYHGRLLTTGYVLTELANGWSGPPQRRAVVAQVIGQLRINPHVVIVPNTEQLFHDGLELFALRPDNDWSLTDCVSFVVMQREGITEALTGDRHFEQAGYQALLK